ncbi:MAG: hypothetical protein AB7F21_07540 [Desulfuromonadales bacterium]
MFSPDPKKAQEPVFLNPGKSFVLHLKPWVEPPGRVQGVVERRTVTGVKAVRFKALGGELKVAFNYDPHKEHPTAFFQTDSGEYAVDGRHDSICFTATPGGLTRLYLELA